MKPIETLLASIEAAGEVMTKMLARELDCRSRGFFVVGDVPMLSKTVCHAFACDTREDADRLVDVLRKLNGTPGAYFITKLRVCEHPLKWANYRLFDAYNCGSFSLQRTPKS